MSRASSRTRRPARSRGYTAVEVMLAMTVMIISSAGVMSMQRAAIQGNLDARKLDVANSIARVWLDRLATDATSWDAATGLTQTLWLGAVVGSGFVQPSVQPAAQPVWSPAFDMLGRDLPNTADPTTAFCVHIKVDTMANAITPIAGGAAPAPALLSATVLVFWPKNLINAGVPALNICQGGPGDVAAAEAASPGTYHLLYATEALRRN